MLTSIGLMMVRTGPLEKWELRVTRSPGAGPGIECGLANIASVFLQPDARIDDLLHALGARGILAGLAVTSDYSQLLQRSARAHDRNQALR